MTELKLLVIIELSKRGVSSVKLEEAEKFQYKISGGSKSQVKEVEKWLECYSKKLPLPDIKYDMGKQTEFSSLVLEELGKIPLGETLSYGEVAKNIGRPRSYRAVGTACGNNPVPLMRPCHRVLASGGKIGGYAYGLTIKRMLLKHEGAL